VNARPTFESLKLKDWRTCAHEGDNLLPYNTNGYVGDCKHCGAAIVRWEFEINLGEATDAE
jgi:hypothetical protein